MLNTLNGEALAEQRQRDFQRPRRQSSHRCDGSCPRPENKVFLLVARQNPFTERILTAPPRRRRSGSNPLKYKKAPRKWGAILWRRRRDFHARAGNQALGAMTVVLAPRTRFSCLSHVKIRSLKGF